MVCILMLQSPETQTMSQQGGIWGSGTELSHKWEIHFLRGGLCWLPTQSTKAAAPTASCKGGQQAPARLPEEEVAPGEQSWDSSVHTWLFRALCVQQQFQLCVCRWVHNPQPPQNPEIHSWLKLNWQNCTSPDKHHWAFGKWSQEDTVPTLHLV